MTRKSHEQPALWEDQSASAPSGPVECLGITFENDAARRAYFTKRLSEKLQDPAFRNIEGFPVGSDDDILTLSDPPYYTACPNPFIEEFVLYCGKPYDANSSIAYRREPLAIDVSAGKSAALYTAHGYHTKVPHEAIMRAILHYTEPGDLVLDGFAGSGMTGVAAQMCGQPEASYRQTVDTEWQAAGLHPPAWGSRRVVLNDLGPAATSIAANYNLPFDLRAFEREAKRMLDRLEDELGWMYETLHKDGETKGRVNYTVWSDILACPHCGSEITFLTEALDASTGRIRENFACPQCGAKLTKSAMERLFDAYVDPSLQTTQRRIKRRPVLIKYQVGKTSYQKVPDAHDIALTTQIEKLPLPPAVPTNLIPFMHMTHQRARMEAYGVTHIHHFYTHRTAYALGHFWEHMQNVDDTRLRNALRFLLDSHLVNLSLQNRYRPDVSFPYNPLGGVYYIGSLVSEANPFIAYENKTKRIVAGFAGYQAEPGFSAITTGDCGTLAQLGDRSIDYIFTDPPFGENIYYSDLNYLVESWHGVWTNAQPEAIVDKAKHKGLVEYQDLMRQCFTEYYRVLKPGRWMTVVFHNSHNAVWNALQEAMQAAGFVIADVRTLDKQQGSYRQVTSMAAKQDLVISSYKPNGGLEDRFKLIAGTEDGVWDFIRTHLRQLPVFVAKNNKAETTAERMPYMLYDRMVAFHVQRGVLVPLSSAEFYKGLDQHFAERDGMYFLFEQLAEYDKKRLTVQDMAQLPLIITDESSAIHWLRQELLNRPQTYQDIHPKFTKETMGWLQYEKPLELNEILEQNFLMYGGKDDVPSQIHSYLSSNYKELRGLGKDDATLRARARDRWYVPDPNKASDLEKVRERTLLRQFEEYRSHTGRQLKVFRLEAIRAGFRRAWQEKDYATIIEMAGKIQENVLQEDQKLIMWYDQALTRSQKE